MLLKFPAELKVQIAEALIPHSLSSSGYLCSNARTLAGDIDQLSGSFRDLSNLSMTCRGLYAICRDLLCQGVRLDGEKNHERFLEDLDNGAPLSSICVAQRARFLSFRNPAYCENCGTSMLDYVHGHDLVIEKLFNHFSSITALELVNFPFTAKYFHDLTEFRELRTLVVREPEPREVHLHFIHSKQTSWSIPAIENLSITVSNSGALESAADLIQLFDRTFISLSLKSEKRGEIREIDYLGPSAMSLANPRFANLTTLKHLHLGYLKTTSTSLRKTIENCANLESLSVDCRGIEGMLPVFYVFDLLHTRVNDHAELDDIVAWDWIQRGWHMDPSMWDDDLRDPYVEDAKIWRRPVASFSWTFNHSYQNNTVMKTPRNFELVLATRSADLALINMDTCFCELSEVFQKHASTFLALKELIIAMSDEVPFEPVESQEELEVAALDMCRTSLPSVEWLKVGWGTVRTVLEPHIVEQS